MGQGARRGKVVALLVALALVAVAVPLAEPVWIWISTEPIELDFGNVRGYVMRKRWGDQKQHGRSELYYKNTGFKGADIWWDNGVSARQTTWTIDGEVEFQQRRLPDGSDEERRSPPWWWGAKDQTHPTAPWRKEEGR